MFRLLRTNVLSGRPGRRPVLIAALVLVAGMALSAAAGQWTHLALASGAQSRFDTTASHAATQIERRFASYAQVLVGLRALFASGEVSRDAFHRFTEALALKDQFPGFQVLNFAPYVPAAAKQTFEKALQQDPSWPAPHRFAIHPPGARDDYHPFTLIEPQAGNTHLLGKDIAAAPHVRTALAVARDTGKLTTSGKLIQVQGPRKHVGLALRLPVYRPGAATDSLSQRRAAYIGSVGAGFEVAEMLSSLPGVPPAWRVRLFEGGPEPIVAQAGGDPANSSDRLVFDSAASGAGGSPLAAQGSFRRVQSFTLGDRVWDVEVSAPAAEVLQAHEQWLPQAVLAAGIVVALLLSGMVLLLGMLVQTRSHPSA
ncbi:CHASE domain-containing protein [Ramlibacter sp. 2FC]|uniref:CHASE domain-containing protein n=1 Tax=Ramlibacter sp. 2FC TaxID=2502188 RepID=UPI0014856C16|nr:CHASE domain-containing protein [Ramlibacter sp. 2FC]